MSQASIRQKIDSSNQNQTGKSFLGKERIRQVLPTPRKTRLESGLTMWKHLQKEKSLKGEDTLTLRWRSAYACTRKGRERAANFEQRTLIFKLSYDKETIPAKLILHVGLVYKILQEKLDLDTNLQHSTITAIVATDPSNPWSWSVIFDSTATKKIYGTGNALIANNLSRLPTSICYGQRVLLCSSL